MTQSRHRIMASKENHMEKLKIADSSMQNYDYLKIKSSSDYSLTKGTVGVKIDENKHLEYSGERPWIAHRPFYVLPAREASWLTPMILNDAPKENSYSQPCHASIRPHSRRAKSRDFSNYTRPATSSGDKCRPFILRLNDTKRNTLPYNGQSSIGKKEITTPQILHCKSVSLDADNIDHKNMLFPEKWIFPPRNELHDRPLTPSSNQIGMKNSTQNMLNAGLDKGKMSNTLNHGTVNGINDNQCAVLKPRVYENTHSCDKPLSFHQRVMDLQKQNMAKLIHGAR